MKKRIVLQVKVIRVNTRTGEGLKEIYQTFNPLLCRLANCYWVDGKETQDKIQDLQIKLWKSLPKYKAKKSSFPTFATKCLKNYIKDELKYQSIRQRKIQFVPLTTETLKQFEGE